MNRRQFIRNTGVLASVPLLLNGFKVTAHPLPLLFGNLNQDSDKVLVIIRLNGGNDGLNTVIPIDQYPRLYKARPELIIPEQQTLKIADKLSLHPAMTGMKALHEEGKLKVIQSVGYPHQNRSHFQSMEIWSTGDPDNKYLTETGHPGWMGRYFDNQISDFPENYPNADYPDPFAISMTYFVSETCQGKAANYSIALRNPFELKQSPEFEESGQYPTYFSTELAYVKLMISQTNKYAERVLKAAEQGQNQVSYPETELGKQLKNVGRLIAGGLKTRIYIADLGGFDTHGGQVLWNNPAGGRHAELLQVLSDSVKALMDDLKKHGLEERVLAMTFSEFGRQIHSNEGLGTDHGTAAPLLLAGACVNPAILGHNPIIEQNLGPQDGIPMQYDFRDVYGSVLKQWFGLPEEDVRQIIFSEFQELPLLRGCSVSTSTEGPVEEDIFELTCYPNPFYEWTTIRFSSKKEHIRLSVYDALGQEIQVLTNQRLTEGIHEVRLEARNWPAGNYFFRILGERGRQASHKITHLQ